MSFELLTCQIAPDNERKVGEGVAKRGGTEINKRVIQATKILKATFLIGLVGRTACQSVISVKSFRLDRS